MGMNVKVASGEYIHTFNPSAGTADNNVLYTSGDVSRYNYHIFDNRSGETIDLEVSVDGTNWAATPASVELIDNTTTGKAYSATIATTKTGILRGKFAKIRVLQNGAGAPAIGEIIIGHGIE